MRTLEKALNADAGYDVRHPTFDDASREPRDTALDRQAAQRMLRLALGPTVRKRSDDDLELQRRPMVTKERTAGAPVAEPLDVEAEAGVAAPGP